MPKSSAYDSDQIVNVPNTLCAIRLLGSGLLLYLAIAQSQQPFLIVFVVLALTDWVDGKLAILLHQRTEFGARLDSVADSALYTVVLFAIFWMKWDVIQHVWPWLAVGVASYWLTSLTGLIKFGRIPSYHTYAAKFSAYLVFIAVVSLFAGWGGWPLKVASAAVTLTNLEATWMTLILPRWISDLRSVFHAYDCRRQVS